MQALILKRFAVDSSPTANLTVDVSGRAPGLVSWFLTRLGLDPTTTLRCYRDRIEFSEGSWSGQNSRTIPLQSVTSILGGYTKPVGYLIAAVISAVLGIARWSWTSSDFALYFGLGAALVFVVFYVLRKEMRLWVQNGGSVEFGLTFRPSVIESVPVDIHRVEKAVQIINQTVLSSKRT